MTPIHLFHRQWAVVVEIERFPPIAARLYAAESALSDGDPLVRDQAIHEAAEIVRRAHLDLSE